MNWKNFGYVCCLSCSFNFILFQVLFVHLKFGERTVELPPEKIPKASTACLTVGIFNLVIVVVAVLYLKGLIKFNPLHYLMRVFNMAGRHGPATGSNRYRMFRDQFLDSSEGPYTGMAQEQEFEVTPRVSKIEKTDTRINQSAIDQSYQLPGEAFGNTALEANETQNQTQENVQKKPSFEMIDLN